jgi:nucleotide-binding universal stress UspA family protein
MVDVRRVLCAVDFSDCSRRALTYAVDLAMWYECRLAVLYVHPLLLTGIALASLPAAPTVPPPAALSPAEREALRRQLHDFVLADTARRLVVDALVREGDVAGEILAECRPGDLLVVGTHGRGGFERLVLGSVAEKVVRKATRPVLTVPPAAREAREAVPSLFRNIVVGIDFSEPSRRALAFALSLAEEADAHLTLVHVVELPRELAEWARESDEGKTYVERWKHSAAARLRELVPPDAHVYCHVHERVETGRPSREILRVAAERCAGLIAMGAHGPDVLERLLVGSTAQHVIRQAGCPVLTVRSPVE